MTTVTRTVRIADPEGLHARPCAALAKAAQRFRCDVVLAAGGRTGNAKSVLELLGMGLLSSTDAEIRATGDDAEECVRVLAELLARR